MTQDSEPESTARKLEQNAGIEGSSPNSANDPVPTVPASWQGNEGGKPLRAFNRSVPEDLRVPWGWWDLLIFLIAGAGAALVISAVTMFIFYEAGIPRDQIQPTTKYGILVAIISMVILSLASLWYLAEQMRFRFRSPFWRTLGWRPLETGNLPPRVAYFGLVISGFLLSMMVAGVSSFFTPKNKMPIEQYFQDRHTALLLLIMSVTIAPLFEETVFRGYLYPVIARTFGIIPGVIFTGALFGLMHAAQLGGNLPQVALIVAVGIVFTSVRAKTGNVLPGYLLHVSYNSFIAIAFLVASHGLRQMPPS